MFCKHYPPPNYMQECDVMILCTHMPTEHHVTPNKRQRLKWSGVGDTGVNHLFGSGQMRISLAVFVLRQADLVNETYVKLFSIPAITGRVSQRRKCPRGVVCHDRGKCPTR